MREKHRIDERFSVLYDHEVDPPQAVRERLAHQMGWDQEPSRTSMWRGWSLLVAGTIMVLVSTVQLNRGTNRTQQTAPALARTQLSEAVSDGPTETRKGAERSGSKQQKDHDTESSVLRARRSHNPSATSASIIQTETRRHSTPTEDPSATMPPSSIVHTTPTVEHAGDGWSARTNSPANPNRVSVPTTGNTEPMVTAWTHPAMPTMEADRMTRIPPRSQEVPMGTPEQAVSIPEYVLPRGRWWWGAYIGAGKPTGQWEGRDEDALNNAERWRGNSQWGVLFGRTWRSGWSLSVGAGLGLIRSSFLFDEQQWEPFMDVDTNWTRTLYNNSDWIYTWTIDTIRTERPGAVRHAQHKNQYGSLQVPIVLAWHGQVRRWHYGTFGGLTFHLPTEQEGWTLHRAAPDARIAMVDLKDPGVLSRFGLRTDAQAGLSLGYSITETLSIHAEPMITLPIHTNGRPEALRFTGRSIQIRIQHELGTR